MQPIDPRGAGGAGKPAKRRLRILLVEDHEDTRVSLARLLGRHHRVHDGSGLELMRALRGCGMRGICLTGFGDEDTEQFLQAGFEHHLTKPIDLAKLEKILSEW